MKAHKIFGSSRLILIALLLIGGMTASAVTYADSIFTPLGIVSEGSYFAGMFSTTPAPVLLEAVVVDEEPASVRTNKSHYSPGDTAIITGENFGAFEAVTLQVTHTDGTPNTGVGHEPWTVTTDGSGFFNSTWYVDPDDSLDSAFLLTAVSATASASTNFSDPGPSADLDQCRNGSAANPNDCIGNGSGGSGWVNGNVGAQQGHFIEGYSIPYRMRMEDMEPGTWTLDIGYDTVHSNKHAIDFLTHYDLMGGSNVTPTVPSHNLAFGHNSECVDPSDTAIGTGNSNNCPTAATPTSFFDIPKPTIPSSLAGNPPGTPPCDSSGGTVVAGASSCPGTTFDAIANAGQAYMTMWNGTITNIEYVQGQQNVSTGGGKQHTMIRIYFTLTQDDVDADDGNVVLGWGGHIAREQDWGTDNSAGGISGSPYHMNLHGLCSGSTPNNGTLCSAGGAQDRSLSGAAVFQTGTVIIKKVIQNGTPDGTFGYTTTGSGLSNFNLTTVGGTAETTFEGILPGAKSVDETTIPNTHLFVSLVCDDAGTAYTNDGKKASFTLDGGETVTCTYTNRENPNVTQGRIVIIKDTIPNDSQSFTFTPSYPGVPPYPGGTFSLIDGGQNDSCGAGDNCLPAGVPQSVTETPNANYVTTASCGGIGESFNAATGTLSGIPVAAGETTFCTFTNTKKGAIKIVKNTTGGDGTFQFNPTGFGSGSFDLTTVGGTANTTFSNIAPGSGYSINETDPAPAFDLTSFTCDRGTTAAIEVVAGETTTCTATNVRRGAIKIVKNTVGGDGTFQFNPTGFGSGSFDLTTVGGTANTTFSNIVPGSGYSINETNPAPAFDLTGFTCDRGTTAAIEVVAGETTTCTAVNTRRGRVIINKVAIGGDDTFLYVSNIANFPLTTVGGTASNTLNNVVPGNYFVREALGEFLPEGWDFNTLTCDDPSGGTSVVGAQANIGLAPGETVECTFTNTKRGHLELEKFTNGQARPDIDINFNLYRDGVVDGDLSGDETLLQSLSTLGDADGNLVFNEVPPGNYTVCEYPVPAGFTSMWTINGNVVTPYNPQANDTPPEDTGIRCYDFTIAAGETVSIHVDNDFPGGDPRTIGYWKNWNRCTNGGQAANADANGGGANGFWLLEDLLPQTVGDLTVTNCQDAVDILNKSDLNGRKKANDAAYELAAQLLAAKLNLAAGAETCTAVQTAVIDGQALLESIHFDGTGNYLPSKVKGADAVLRTQALQLANTLDQYNNGNLCP